MLFRNNVLIGAGAVVTKDIPDNAVAVGVPAKVISYDGKTKVKHYHIVLIKSIFTIMVMYRMAYCNRNKLLILDSIHYGVRIL